MNPIPPEPCKEFEYLPVPTTKLNEFDHLILFTLAESNTPKGVPDIIRRIEDLWSIHNLTFHRSNGHIPTRSYFYNRLEKLTDWFYINKVGKRAYRLNWQTKKLVVDYIMPYIRSNYKIKNDRTV